MITDGSSTDDTREIIESSLQKARRLSCCAKSFSLPGRSRNIGARQCPRANGSRFIDAGTRPEPDWLERLAAAVIYDSQIDVVYGSFEPKIDSFFEECAAIAYVPARQENGARPQSIASALMRRKVWERSAVSRKTCVPQKTLLFMRKVEAAGFHVASAPDAIVHWNLQPNLWRTFRRFTTYARHNIRAGLWREWQLAIFKRYGLLLLFAVPAIFAAGGGWWFRQVYGSG